MAIEQRDPASPVAALLAALGEFRVHDASPLIEPGMPMFVAYEGPQITPLFGHEEAGAAANRISLAEHTGTHLDAPFHFDRHGATVDELAPDALLLRPYKKFDLVGRWRRGRASCSTPTRWPPPAARAGFALEPGDVAIVEMGWDRHWPAGPGGAAARLLGAQRARA